MPTDFAPSDDRSVECFVNFWGHHVTVTIHPTDWKQVSIRGKLPMIIAAADEVFSCSVRNAGEHYRQGTPDSMQRKDFKVPTDRGYAGWARIDWAQYLPELLLSRLEEDPALLTAWKSLTFDEMRQRLSFILRARTTGAIADRQLSFLKELATKAEDKAG